MRLAFITSLLIIFLGLIPLFSSPAYAVTCAELYPSFRGCTAQTLRDLEYKESDGRSRIKNWTSITTNFTQDTLNEVTAYCDPRDTPDNAMVDIVFEKQTSTISGNVCIDTIAVNGRKDSNPPPGEPPLVGATVSISFNSPAQINFCVSQGSTWLKTIGGDVHSNVRINTPGGP